VSAGTGALQPVLGKLSSLLDEDYKRLRSIHTEINFLTRELKALDTFLEKMAEEENPNPQDKLWMNQVREFSYDFEDNLDEFMAHVIADKSAKPDGFMDKIKGSLKRIKARHDIAKAIEDLKKQAIEVSQGNARYWSGKAGDSNTSSVHTKIDLRALAIFEDTSKLIGVDEPTRDIIQLLADCKATKNQPNVVAIVGPGGLGKTTIAKRVYQELKGQFKYHAFLSVSRNPDIARVMSNIYGQLDKDYSPCTEILETIITKIRDFLENGRFNHA
jgi:disease resistance protein RPM1